MTTNQFIEMMVPVIRQKCIEHGWGVPSAIIAQAALESRWGGSGLALECFNYWGMKWKAGCGCNYKEYKTQEQNANGAYYTVVAKFRRYNNIAEGIEGYFRFIESYPRYDRVRGAKTYKQYCTLIKECGWATSLAYTTNLINVVEKYGLTKYDADIAQQAAGTRVYPTLRQGTRGGYVLLLQNKLYEHGLVLDRDGIFGPVTKNCVIAFQGASVDANGVPLTKDGIVGPKTWAALLQ